MPKNSELTEAVWGKFLGLRAGGSSIPKISKALKVLPTTAPLEWAWKAAKKS